MSDKSKNVIVFFTDQQRWDSSAIYGVVKAKRDLKVKCKFNNMSPYPSDHTGIKQNTMYASEDPSCQTRPHMSLKNQVT